jgi:hypothetical protein
MGNHLEPDNFTVQELTFRYRRAAGIKKVNEPCKPFSTTGISSPRLILSSFHCNAARGHGGILLL